MFRDFVALISMLCAAIFGGYAVVLAVSTIFGLGGVSRRGTTLDADWPTTGLVALAALLFYGLYRWASKGRPPPPTNG